MRRQPIKHVYNVNHWRFQRMLPHGSLPTRKFSLRPRDPESDPWFKVSLVALVIGYFLLCVYESVMR